MEIFPAIDIQGGNVVRLTQGDYGHSKTYSDAPVEAAMEFLRLGASCLHVVDLDGARDGAAANLAAIRDICGISRLFVEVGGGIRDERSIERCLSLGAGRAILGTVAAKDFPFAERMAKKYGGRIAVGVDARDQKVAVSGWAEATEIDSFEFCERLNAAGVETVIYTDISRDGGLSGANLDAYRRLRGISPLHVVASGGISYESELKVLRDMGNYAAILGKALYENWLSLPRALAIAEGREPQ
ncbi:MAG: 1-(5-phosphoribosyl)-5-[(5-phosphoribosylamino)methylideneamino]imidazole-4-carboxamide isomerase [Clostridiales bacterium]|nr:1-(5-phosphoribosyl)-5-[(5-phosphoribosylamino)methylideneamino]imidazole-4-carboxamide isomerase [Clostridiales bacterium]